MKTPVRLAKATRRDAKFVRVYLFNMHAMKNGNAPAVEIRNGHPHGFPTAIDVAESPAGKKPVQWTLDSTPIADPSGSLAALVRLAGEEWERNSNPEKLDAYLAALSRYTDTEKKQLAKRGLAPQCEFKPDREQIKWTAAREWDRWNKRGLQWGERMQELEKMGCEGFAEMSLTTFQSLCARAMGLKIVKG